MITLMMKWKLIKLFHRWCDRKDITKNLMNFIYYLTTIDVINQDKLKKYLDLYSAEDLLL